MVETNEIDDITPNRHLPLEFRSPKARRAEVIPKPVLGIGHSASKLPTIRPLHTPLPARPSADPPSPPRGEGKPARFRIRNQLLRIFTCYSAASAGASSGAVAAALMASSTGGGLRLGATSSSPARASFSRASSASRWRFHIRA